MQILTETGSSSTWCIGQYWSQDVNMMFFRNGTPLVLSDMSGNLPGVYLFIVGD